MIHRTVLQTQLSFRHVMELQCHRATGEKYREIARDKWVFRVLTAMTQEEYRKAAIDAVRKLSEDVGIPC